MVILSLEIAAPYLLGCILAIMQDAMRKFLVFPLGATMALTLAACAASDADRAVGATLAAAPATPPGPPA